MVWAYRLIWLYYWANKTNRSIIRHHVKLLRPYKHEWAGVLQYLWNESFHSQPIYITSVWVCHLINLVISISVWPHCAIFALWVIIQSRWQQLFDPNQPTLLGNFCKGVKVIYFSSEIILGNFYRLWRFLSGHNPKLATFKAIIMSIKLFKLLLTRHWTMK